ncbi:CidA/LrgA family protein [Myceligenerans pegani]|uniref:CidA/LrgA family protein n=1 Tax=Myceligenerans pegani TaxID=2776917 RepID=A0ABR9N5M9_9MICO|nr:CidA/LrgA family protein [Myceligenerans sp. TRM 65318]MBE1878302.1 CidA/LrgA family protein [Myceligenerans sp. TRM 65318]MBE3020573.1 CidA/LrgA family protein [Myceligenerans sp. TRM 65318]
MSADDAGPPPPPTGSIARWLSGFAVLALVALGGEVVSRVLALPLPGPTLGMLVLLGLLLTPWGAALTDAVLPASDSLIALLPLLLVPLAVGVLASLDDIVEHGTAIAVALVVGWVATFLTAIVAMRLLNR